MLKVLYFSYGSNLSLERLKFRVEYRDEPVERGVVYNLQNYRLVFNAGCGYANIEPHIGSSVEGVLYDLSPFQFGELDKYEALYSRHFFQINSTTIGCVYIAKSPLRYGVNKPSLDYLNIIIDGCKDYGLVKTYNILVAYKQKNYKLKRNKHKLSVNTTNFYSNHNVENFIV